MDRTERLLDLIATLLAQHRPVSFEEIREWFPLAYATENEDAGKRTFERDKDDLRELGIALRWVQPDPDEEDGDGGYVIDRADCWLPELSLDGREVMALRLSALALLERPEFPWRDELHRALCKLDLDADAHADEKMNSVSLFALPPLRLDPTATDGAAEGDAALGGQLSLLGEAIDRCKRVEFVYRARQSGEVTRRSVDPWGLYCRRGRWMLVGHSHERGAVRSFFVSRMRELRVNDKKPKQPDFEPPTDFDPRTALDVPDFLWGLDEPVRVRLDVDGDYDWLARRYLRAAGTPSMERAGWTRYEVEATDPDALLRWVLGLGPHAILSGPPELRAQLCSMLDGIAARHGGA